MCERGGSGARGVECDGLQRFQGCLADADLCFASEVSNCLKRKFIFGATVPIPASPHKCII